MKKIAIILVMLVLSGATSVWAGSVKTMDKEELKAMLDSPELVLLDVRRGRDWSSSEFKITGAQRLESDGIASAVSTLSKDKIIVLYCA
jgi:rhodanese-related sulfurtransferase